VISSSLLVFHPDCRDYITPAQVGGTSGIMIGSIIQSCSARPTTCLWRSRIDRHDAGGDGHRLPLLVERGLPQDEGPRA